MKIILEKAFGELMHTLKACRGRRFDLDSIINSSILPKIKVSKITKGHIDGGYISGYPAAKLQFGNEEIRLAVVNRPNSNVSGVYFQHLTPNPKGQLEVTTNSVFTNNGEGFIEQLRPQADGSRFVVGRSSSYANGQLEYVPYRAVTGAPKITTLGSGISIR